MRLMLERLAAAPLVMLAVSLIAFALLSAAPGDAVTARLGADADPAAIATLRAAAALDAPLPVRYAVWLGQLASGDLGRSLQTGRPVSGMVLAAAGPTLELAASAFLVSLTLGLPLGVLAAVRRGRAADRVCTLLAAGGAALPVFWIALLLILHVSVRWHVLPSSGRVAIADSVPLALRHLILPTLALTPALTGGVLRMTRAALLEVLAAEFVLTARAKGLPSLRVVGLHALRPAAGPVVALLALHLAQLLGGAAVVETMFGWPGLGKLTVDAALARDAPVVQGVLLSAALAVLLTQAAGEALADWLDPRLRR